GSGAVRPISAAVAAAGGCGARSSSIGPIDRAAATDAVHTDGPASAVAIRASSAALAWPSTMLRGCANGAAGASATIPALATNGSANRPGSMVPATASSISAASAATVARAASLTGWTAAREPAPGRTPDLRWPPEPEGIPDPGWTSGPRWVPDSRSVPDPRWVREPRWVPAPGWGFGVGEEWGWGMGQSERPWRKARVRAAVWVSLVSKGT